MCSIADNDDFIEVYIERRQKARKNHKCSACGGPIHVGTKYVYHFVVMEKEMYTSRSCLACDEALGEFGAAHEVMPFPANFRRTLIDCIAEGDEESERKWKPMLAEMDARAAL